MVVDPRTTPLAKSADIHLAVKPGTDVAVALAIHRHLFTSGPAMLPTSDDLVSIHLHGSGKERPPARTIEAARKVADAYASGKPVLCADLAAAGEEDSLWALTFAGAGALAPRGARLDVLAGFLRSFHAAPLAPSHDVRVSRGAARAWSLVTPDALSRGFWLLGAPERYALPVAGVELVLPAPPAGRYVVSWLDDATGAAVASSVLTSAGSGDVPGRTGSMKPRDATAPHAS